jgi:hypothetical protein
VENLRETVGLMASLNVFNTPELVALHADIEDRLCKHEVKDLRDSISVAQSTKTAADEILRRIASYGVSGS